MDVEKPALRSKFELVKVEEFGESNNLQTEDSSIQLADRVSDTQGARLVTALFLHAKERTGCARQTHRNATIFGS